MSNYKLKIALDTQILSYLVDKTFPCLNKFIEFLSESPHVDIVCSRFVTFEFIGIRKHEHYLREIHDFTNGRGGVMNFSSALKYKSGWSAPELPYESTYKKIKAKVENDLKIINDDFNIEYVDVDLCDGLWGPLNNLILSSKISKEDSLVLLSSLWIENENNQNIIFLTNDKQFNDAFCSTNRKERMDAIDDVFNSHNIVVPQLTKIYAIKIKTGKEINLTNSTESDEELQKFTKSFLTENLQKKYERNFLGKVVKCSDAMYGKLLCIKLQRAELQNNIYITIIPIDGESYNHEESLIDFHNINIGLIPNYPYIPDEKDNSKIISVILKDSEGKFLAPEIYNKIATPGNLIFIHPDSML